MKVRELLARLRDADPEAEVRFMPLAADSTESDSVDEVEFQAELWTFEEGDGYSVYYPGEPEQRDAHYENVRCRLLPVVLLKPDMPARWKELLEQR